MLAVNLGTRGPDEARRLLEYCNFPSGTEVLRPAPRPRLGRAARRQVLVPRQRDGRPLADGRKTATEYGRVATEAAKLMRIIDPTIELAAVGSSGRNMPTFGAWEREVLEHTFDHVEFISLHTYLNDYAKDTPAFLASPDLMDGFIEEVVAIADEVAERARIDQAHQAELRRVERLVPHAARRRPQGAGLADRAADPRGGLHDEGRARLRRRLHLAPQPRRPGEGACLAQLVNAIAPILTETGGPAWRQTIFWPFADFSNLGRGEVLQLRGRLADLRTRLPRPARRDRLSSSRCPGSPT